MNKTQNMAQEDKARVYWENNINEWGKYYLNISHTGEKLDAPRWLDFLYKHTVTPIETRLMSKRYELTLEFIRRYVKTGDTVVDIGCGTGVFTVEFLKQGASVHAVDFSNSAIETTKAMVDRYIPEKSEQVEYHLMDICEKTLPPSDVALAMGVAPYISDMEKFYAHILPTTKIFCCLVLDPAHWANKIRENIPLLNVRKLLCFERSKVDAIYEEHGWQLVERTNFASGYIDIAKRNSQ